MVPPSVSVFWVWIPYIFFLYICMFLGKYFLGDLTGLKTELYEDHKSREVISWTYFLCKIRDSDTLGIDCWPGWLCDGHLTRWQPGGWTSGWLFVDTVHWPHIRMLRGTQPFYVGDSVQVCSAKLPRSAHSRFQIPQGLRSYIFRLKLFLLNRMKQRKMTEKEMTPESGSWAQIAPSVITSCVDKALNVTSFKALLIFLMRSTPSISESYD